MKSVIIALVLASSSPCSTSVFDSARLQAVEFDKYWNRYARGLFGCPEVGEMTPLTCHDAESHVDAEAYSKAYEIAERLFPRGKQ